MSVDPKQGVDMLNRQRVSWAKAACAVVWSVVVLWCVPVTAASPELKGKFEVLKGEVSTHTPGKVK
jgi:protein dithiol oxidoreductase (disulfide-forming)